MPKQVISTENAPAAVGAYSQGIIANGFVFTAGQIPLIPGRSNLREGGIQAQTRQSLTNHCKAVLDAAGSGMDRVVKTTVFLADINGLRRVQRGLRRVLQSADPPARSTVQAGGLPVGALVEIEAVALLE